MPGTILVSFRDHYSRVERSAAKKTYTDTRRSHYEELRKNKVPRYLFRAWCIESGGGPSICKNTVDEIIPAAFLKKPSAPADFYAMGETKMKYMAEEHYFGRTEPLTCFSSWAASLHLVLCYANSRKSRSNSVHVACMDTTKLDNEVFVWHVPHLLPELGCGYHEYLAYGKISGPGYTAVPLSTLLAYRVEEFFPGDINDSATDGWGTAQRRLIWTPETKKAPVPLKPDTLSLAHDISNLFGPLHVPVALALVCMRPRYYYNREEYSFISLVKKMVDWTPLPAEFLAEKWTEEGSVFTGSFEDVRQWIRLYRTLAHVSKRESEPEPYTQRIRVRSVTASVTSVTR